MEQEKVSCELLYQSLSNTATCMNNMINSNLHELNKMNESVGAFRKVTKMWFAESYYVELHS